ncbi:hypothetical protein AB3S75_016874 [Citrus x aurantiifolia]
MYLHGDGHGVQNQARDYGHIAFSAHSPKEDRDLVSTSSTKG